MTKKENAEIDPRESARNAIISICDELNIQNIVYVDDIFDLKYEVEQVIGWFEELRAEDPEKCSAILDGIPFEDDDIWKGEVRNRFEILDEDKKSSVVKQLNFEREDNQIQGDFESSNVLKDLFPEGKYIQIGPSEWEDQKKQLISEAEEKKSLALCLFDQDLYHAKKFRGNNDGINGLDLLENSISTMDANSFLFGIFSHHIELNEELIKWREIAEEKSLNKSQFLPLSKKRRENPTQLAFGFQMMVLNIFSEKLKNIAEDAFTKSHENAVEKIKNLEVYDFHEMVMESSFKEGEWEINTLLRLYQIFQRDETRKKLLDKETIQEFNKHSLKARNINKHNFDNDFITPNQKWGIRHQELYQDSETLNKLHHPLRNGDIFKIYVKGQSKNIYMLIAQPCDLMVRADGNRDNQFATLVRLKKEKKERFHDSVTRVFEKYRTNLLELKYPIPYIEDKSNKIGVLDFKDISVVNLDVLDLTVLNEEGRCKINLSNVNIPPQLNDSYSKRIHSLSEYFKSLSLKVSEKISVIEGSIPEEKKEKIIESIMPCFSLGTISLRKKSFEGDEIDFGIKRILHYREPNSTQALNAYTNFMARDAKKHDFAMELN